MIETKADLLVDCRCELGEGVQWHAATARVWWTDIHGRALWSCDADGGGAEAMDLPERLGSFAFDPEGRLLCAFESGLFRLDPETGHCDRLTHFEPDHPTSRYNDGRCDRQGRFVVGGMDEDGLKPTSSLTRYDGRTVETLEAGIGVSNSICFSPDGRWMYFADTPTGRIRRHPYDPETGAVGAAETVHLGDRGDGFPDGSCVDAAGAIWNARWGAGRVIRLTPSGEVTAVVTVDAKQPSCACFGGPGLDRLYITTAREGLDEAELTARPWSGGLFIAEPGAVGLPEDGFRQGLF